MGFGEGINLGKKGEVKHFDVKEGSAVHISRTTKQTSELGMIFTTMKVLLN